VLKNNFTAQQSDQIICYFDFVAWVRDIINRILLKKIDICITVYGSILVDTGSNVAKEWVWIADSVLS